MFLVWFGLEFKQGVEYQAVPVVLQVSVGPERSVSGQLAADGNNLTFLHAEGTQTQTLNEK